MILVVLAGIIVPFVIWGALFDEVLSLEGARKWMEGYGDWAWAAGIALLISDIVLPVPSTVVMSALGWKYGWWLGGLICVAGSMLSGIIAYASCRWLGRGAARWIAGEDGLQRGEEIFEKRGGWLVALSRWMPVLPEAVACLAGLSNMRWRVFLPALGCGSVPLGFAFAAIGHLGQSEPGWAIALSCLVPVLLWLGAARVLRR
ncbi:VTT domain-containing protein [Prosthecobacter sp.]|uniref:TVP38/TMEM64 family protein n=1 Tax=Prosthecobacter sp. TaxID=1965333 RepID=UPI002AB8C1E0|nr:VTT domain-containing protein [Prosthecobacter sp.]MDZ4402001.1 VTT domain-containing protein [Prosthecobacter sp.]